METTVPEPTTLLQIYTRHDYACRRLLHLLLMTTVSTADVASFKSTSWGPHSGRARGGNLRRCLAASLVRLPCVVARDLGSTYAPGPLPLSFLCCDFRWLDLLF